MRTLANNKLFRFFFASNCFDFIGERCTSIALPILLYTITGNLYSTAILMLCRFFPRFVSNYFVKKINDSHIPMFRLLKGIALVRMTLFPLFLFAHSQWHYYALTLLDYFSGSLCYAYRYAAIRDVCSDEELPSANNFLPLAENMMMLCTPLLGGWLYTMVGLPPLVLLSAVCFFLSFLNLSILGKVQPNRPTTLEPKQTPKPVGFLKSLVGAAQKYPSAFLLIAVDTVTSISFGALNTLMPMVTQTDFGNSATVYSSMNSALFLGLILGNAVFHWKLRASNFRMTYLVSTLFATVTFMLLGLGGSPLIFLLLLILVGAGNSVQDASLATEIQTGMDSVEDISFAFSTYQSLAALLIMATTLIVPLIITALGTTFLFVSLGLVNLCGLLLLWKRR